MRIVVFGGFEDCCVLRIWGSWCSEDFRIMVFWGSEVFDVLRIWGLWCSGVLSIMVFWGLCCFEYLRITVFREIEDYDVLRTWNYGVLRIWGYGGLRLWGSWFEDWRIMFFEDYVDLRIWVHIMMFWRFRSLEVLRIIVF